MEAHIGSYIQYCLAVDVMNLTIPRQYFSIQQAQVLASGEAESAASSACCTDGLFHIFRGSQVSYLPWEGIRMKQHVLEKGYDTHVLYMTASMAVRQGRWVLYCTTHSILAPLHKRAVTW